MTTLNDSRRQMLASISHTPRDLRFFTNGKIQNPITEEVARLYLANMVDDGLLANLDGLYVITRAGLAALEASRLTPMATYTNATTQGYYKQRWATPARGEAALRAAGIRSFGTGC